MNGEVEILSADFETTTDPDDCRVWAAGWCNIKDNKVHSVNSIDEFLKAMSKRKYCVYFHNLAFDGSFILDWLLRNGYEYQAVTRREYPKKNKFTTTISKDSKFYGITVCWKNGVITEFRDSLKKIPISVSAMAKAFNVEESKLSIDYDEIRPVGHVLTDMERDYLNNDIVIVSKALTQTLKEGMTHLTVGADALAEYKRTRKDFNDLFPVLPLDMDSDIRLAYRGGFTSPKKTIVGTMIGEGLVLDVNSLYPYVMRTKRLPVGWPRWEKNFNPEDHKDDLWIASVTFKGKIKRNHIPVIQNKITPWFSSPEYLNEISDYVTIAVTNIDWALINDQYDIDVQSINGGWVFDSELGLFDKYIDKWSKIKAHSEGGLRFIAKLHLNSLYGKFATNPDVTGRIPVLENGVLELTLGPDETRDPVYTPMGVFITSWARNHTIRAAQSVYGRFLYADTDSLHLSGPEVPDGLEVHDTKLGAWKIESRFDKAMFLRAKAYVEFSDENGYNNHIAGVPRSIADGLTFNDLKNGNVLHGKLLPKRVPGGIVLSPTEFTLKW